MNYSKLRAFAPLLLAWMLYCPRNSVQAHEGHDDLPSVGIKVVGNRLMISPAAEKSLGVATTVVHLRDLARDVMANASVEVPWKQHAFATTLVDGRVLRVLVQRGETVQAGQELATIESKDIETLQLELLNAVSEHALAERMVEQRSALAISGSIAERRLLESQGARDQWAARRGIATRKLLSLGLTPTILDRVISTGKPTRSVPVTSPLTGVVSESRVYTGQVVQPWQQIYEIVDLSTVWLHGQVLETDCAAVAEGQPVSIKIDAWPEETFQGVVDHVGVKVDPESRSLHVHVAVDNSRGLLRAGMFGRLKIRTLVVQQAVACPLEAIIDRGDQPSVLVQERDGVFVRQPVKLGLRSGGFVEVIDGLFPGDPVVHVGKLELASLFAPEPSQVAQTREPAKAVSGQVEPASATSAAPRAARQVLVGAEIELPTDKMASAYSTVEGRIVTVLVEHGETVAAGQVLAEVESLELRNEQLDLLESQSRLRMSQKALERFRKLVEEGAGAQKDLWQLETDTTNLQTAVATRKNKLSLLGLSDDDLRRFDEIDITSTAATENITTTLHIRAPMAGRITVFDLSVGQVVRPNDELFEIHDLSRVLVRGYVHEQDASAIGVGDAVTVSIMADPTFSATSTISRTAPTLSTFGRATTVWAEVDNRDGRLKTGMLARMAIDAQSRSSDASTAQAARHAKSIATPTETGPPADHD